MLSKKLLLTLLIIPVFATSLSGCATKQIPFEIITKQGDYLENNLLKPQIAIVTNEEAAHISGILSRDQALIQAVDYPQSFAVVAFHGRAGYVETIYITKIWQTANTVHIRADFTSSMATAESSTYQIIRINKSQLSQLGNITFVLIDQAGKERASVTANITT